MSVSVCAGATVIESPGVHAHRIEVFDGADDDAVVLAITHHFHLKFFPTEHRFFQQQLARGRGVEPALHDGLEFLAVVGDAATAAAHREGRTDDDRIADAALNCQRLFQAACDLRARHFQADLAHGVTKALAILGHVDGLARGRDHLDVELLEHAFAHQIERGVQCRLPSHGGKQRIGPFGLNDPRQSAPVDRLDVNGVGHAPDRS